MPENNKLDALRNNPNAGANFSLSPSRKQRKSNILLSK